VSESDNMTPFVALLAATCTSAATIQSCQNSRTTLLVAAAPGPILPTPAAKVLDVGLSTASETALLLIVLKVAALLIKGMEVRGSETLAKVFSQLTWLVVVQGSARLAGMVGVNNQIARPTKVLNPAWYDSLAKPSWNPPPWAFPLAWIPLKILQTFAANLAWTTSGRKVFSLPIVLFVTHIALGDVWNAQFFLKQRPLTGVFVISIFWCVLLAATLSLYNVNPLSAYLVAPTIAWVFVAANLNLDVWYLNKDRKK
jgi:tryptophan-rich sensory protein